MYIKDSDDNFSAQAIAAIGTSAQLVPAIAEDCLKALIKLSQSKNGQSLLRCVRIRWTHSVENTEIIITQSVEILRALLQSPSFPPTVSKASIITRLVLLLENGKIKAPTARADIFWLVGQFAEVGTVGESVGPDLIRIGAKGFIEEVRFAFPSLTRWRLMRLCCIVDGSETPAPHSLGETPHSLPSLLVAIESSNSEPALQLSHHTLSLRPLLHHS